MRQIPLVNRMTNASSGGLVQVTNSSTHHDYLVPAAHTDNTLYVAFDYYLNLPTMAAVHERLGVTRSLDVLLSHSWTRIKSTMWVGMYFTDGVSLVRVVSCVSGKQLHYPVMH